MIWSVNQIVLFNGFLSDFVEITLCVYTKTIILFNLGKYSANIHLYFKEKLLSIESHGDSKGGAVVRALASHQCGLGSNPGVNAICGLCLLLVLSLTSRGFSPGTPVFSSPQKTTLPNSNSICNAQTRFNKFLNTQKCSVGKQITTFFLTSYR